MAEAMTKRRPLTPADLLVYARGVVQAEPRETTGPRSIIAVLREQNAKLQAHRYFPISPFWDAELDRIERTKVRRVVAQVGRRGIKTTTACQIAVASATGIDWPIPPGERGIFGVISVNKVHAGRRLHTIKSMLEALGFPFVPVAGGLRLLDRPIDIQIYACSYRAVVGDIWIGLAGDEVARWRDEDASADPAREVLASARPCMMTMRSYGAMEWLISTPWSEQGTFYELVEEGDTDEQVVVRAPTWVANPAWTEEQTHLEEPDEFYWRREYAAIPMPRSVLGVLDSRRVKWLDGPPEKIPGDAIVAGADLALKQDSSTLAIAFIRDGRYIVRLLREWRPDGGDLELTPVCEAIRAELLEHGAANVMADQHYRERLREVTRDVGLVVVDAPTQPVEGIVRLRDLLREGKLEVWCDAPMRKRLSYQLDGVQLVPTTTGLKVVYLRDDGAHGDLVAALALACYQQSGVTVPLEQREQTHKELARSRAIERKKAAGIRYGGGVWGSRRGAL